MPEKLEMKNENWQQVETIFHQALDFAGEERQKYLEQTCSHDAILLDEVKSLISSFESEAEFLEKPIIDLSLTVIQQKTEKTRTNTTLGFYEIGEKIGSGGMGEVYQAIDTRLNRKVALKFLPESLKHDNVAKRQLQKEAQAVAMLEHPNICAVHGIEEIENENFIVMQFVEGVTLEKSLETMEVTTESFQILAKQIVSAISLAHSHGVIHRDIKPGNIMLSGDENIKVLDFGLAKVIGQQKIIGNGHSAHSSQISTSGLVIGTVSYMSPEQLRGEKLDYQTDIFSLGIILYELLAKKNPFHRQTKAETIAAILSDNSITAEKITPKPSSSIVNLIDKCLAKDKNKRFQSAAEVFVEMENISETEKQKKSYYKYFVLNKYLFVSLIFIALFGVLFYLNQSSSVPSFAILPIENESNNPEIDYLSEGLTEGLINKFSRFSKLKIKSSKVVSKYKGKQSDALEVGKELNVDAVVMGKIVKREDSVIFQINLLDTKDGSQLWSNEFILNKENLVKTQEEISTQIISKFNLNLTNEEIRQLNKRQTTSSFAEEQFFRGRYYLNQRTRQNIDIAIQYFEKAIEIDPLYAKAYSGLADCYVHKSSPAFGSLTPVDSMTKAKAAARQALQFDNNLSEAYTTLGLIKLRYEWNWREAESDFLKSIELDPNYAQPHYWYSHLLLLKKDFEGAMVKAKKAFELDPLTVNNEINIARIYYYERQTDKAIQLLTKILQVSPTNRVAAYTLGLTYLQKGSYQDAIEIFEKFYPDNKLHFAAQLGYAYGKANRKADAQRVLNELEEFSIQGEIIPANEEAIIHLGMGNKEKAFELFRLSCRERFASLPWLLTEAYFDRLRSDSEYLELTNCIQSLN